MSMYRRKDGEEHPFWKAGPFQIRLPFIHFRPELPEMLQGIVLFAIGLSIVPILENVAGMPYEAALAVSIIYLVTMLMGPLFGVPLVPGFITAGIPLFVIFLESFEPGPEAIQGLIALQLTVAVIFLIFGVTGFGKMIVTKLPNSLKAGILIGAGVAAIYGEIIEGGRLANTPISLIIGAFICLYVMFSGSFSRLYHKSRFAKIIGNFGIMTGISVAVIIGWLTKEYSAPTIEWGFVIPNVAELWNYTPFVLGFPSFDIFLMAIPTALIAYIIAYGDIVVGVSLVERAQEIRKDEKIRLSIRDMHVMTFLRNAIHAFIAPHPGLAGPIFTAGTATVLERYKYGRKAMDSVYSGSASLIGAMLLATLLLPLVSLFQPVLPIALSLTMIITGYLCISIGIEQLTNQKERGVAGIMAIVLFTYGAAHALIVGFALYFLIQKTRLFAEEKDEAEADDKEKIG